MQHIPQGKPRACLAFLRKCCLCTYLRIQKPLQFVRSCHWRGKGVKTDMREDTCVFVCVRVFVCVCVCVRVCVCVPTLLNVIKIRKLGSRVGKQCRDLKRDETTTPSVA